MVEAAAFARRFIAGWGDMDFNRHMRNTAFLDRAADVRMMFFAAHGFPMREFARQRLGPVVLRDVVEYRKEVALLDEIDVSLALAGLATDGSRFLVRNEVSRADGTLCATVTSYCGWLDLAARKLASPPANLLAAMRALPRTADYEDLPLDGSAPAKQGGDLPTTRTR